jgi:hypothetical protein
VEVALEFATVRIGQQHEPSARGTELFDLEAEPLESLLHRLDVFMPDDRISAGSAAPGQATVHPTTVLASPVTCLAAG